MNENEDVLEIIEAGLLGFATADALGVPVEFRVKYNPEEKGPALSVPNTGGITIGGLTISRADYIVSGLVIFGAAAAGGLFLMNRKKKSNKSRK